ncbi:helix-turn-helix transcriptional regulator [Carnobacterium maltaromaticum]|uniref:helix-turn-helix transcriptional regulator n=1 Tax=Carnobacterium maltaromaticum TaxID=2751 RepID=UPI00298B725F|nr:helix-turn-helix transcriptional regulator [Carnobacterium maltaromaticum]MDW5524667.1 helix-turn-helix transcriptional regulator [Carnobacterium maltaromaticum]
MTVNENIRIKVNDYLNRHNMSMFRFSIECDIPTTSLRNLFNLNTNIGIDKIIKIANQLDISLDELVGRKFLK